MTMMMGFGRKKQRVTHENFVSAWNDIRMVRMTRIVAAKEQKCPIAILTYLWNAVLSKTHTFFKSKQDDDGWFISDYVIMGLDWFVTFLLEGGLPFVVSLVTFGRFPKSGCGCFVHLDYAFITRDKDNQYPHYDCLYSLAVLDLRCSDAIITLPEADEMPSNKNGMRYQSMMIVADGKFYPTSVINNKKGHNTEHTVKKEAVGAPHCIVLLRTQVNPKNEVDIARASTYQKRATIYQESSSGNIFKDLTNKWDETSFDEVKKYISRNQVNMGKPWDITKHYKSVDKALQDCDVRERNRLAVIYYLVLPADQCQYYVFSSYSTKPQKLILEDVPVDGFWSITVYNNVNRTQGKFYTQNSSSVKYDSGGHKVTLRFGLLRSNGSKKECEQNFLEIYEGWQAMLRLYKPSKRVAQWACPSLVLEKE